jgi:hypothetical protein
LRVSIIIFGAPAMAGGKGSLGGEGARSMRDAQPGRLLPPRIQVIAGGARAWNAFRGEQMVAWQRSAFGAAWEFRNNSGSRGAT